MLQANGVPAVTVATPTKVNFTVFSDGVVKQGLVLANLSMSIAKLVPGTNGDSTSGSTTSTAPKPPRPASARAATPVLASAKQADQRQQAESDPAATQLVYNTDGYYTYTFSTDIMDPPRPMAWCSNTFCRCRCSSTSTYCLFGHRWRHIVARHSPLQHPTPAEYPSAS